MSDHLDRLQRRFDEAHARRDRPAAEAALAAMRAYTDQLTAADEEATTAAITQAVDDIETELRWTAHFDQFPSYWGDGPPPPPAAA